MTRRRSHLTATFLCVLALLAATPTAVGTAADTLPAKLSDQEFWKLIGEFSEPDGYFRSDNLLSNEIYFPYVIPDLVKRTKPGGVYLGVGPEQNFNYIAALKPKMVFITDIRRGNLHMQLMYKALFEMSADRVEFFARLFTKPRPAGLTARSTVDDIVNAFWDAPTITDEAVYKANLKAIQDHLTRKHGLPLDAQDLAGIEYVYGSFYWHGPRINYNSSNSGGRGGQNMVTYGELMIATDGSGVSRSYLATDESFRTIKELQEKNLIVPLVGNFGGPKALRAVGRYLKDHGATVAAFYLSNVEQYLSQDGLWSYFCANVASMPLDEQSTFIRSTQGGGGGPGGGLVNSLGAMKAETQGCGGTSRPVAAGVRTSR